MVFTTIKHPQHPQPSTKPNEAQMMHRKTMPVAPP